MCDLRYNLSHIGDIFIGAVQKTADTAMQCSKGVFLTYDINMLHCKKQKASREIGERVSLLVKEGTFDVPKDTALLELITKLNSIEKDLATLESERANLLSIFKIKKTAFEGSTNQ
jgi:hypothetical protein